MPKSKRKSQPLPEFRNKHMADIIERNITTLLEVRKQMEGKRNVQHHIADAITAFSGSLPFLYAHVAWFLVWIVINLGWLRAIGIPAFDPFPFGLLTMIVSLEAIFLSTFVLISQSRLSEISDQRADLDLQINLLTEYEVTKMMQVLDVMAAHMGVNMEERDSELKGLLEQDIVPGAVLQQMEARERDLLRKNLEGTI